MQFSIFLISLLAALEPVIASCTYNGRACQWAGTAPFCGQHKDRADSVCIDSPDPSYICFTGTQDESAKELRQRLGSKFENCYQDYGKGCFSGYKELYCKYY
ncbi:hypothetical protein QBC38DRAFT_500757 [Podospora fimiseda]|uniref:Uncharacterized protein n=1 Tax=Podospora fimiseda TaxID=252190 RepID=A0AAN7BMF9_9PEZI|nr:hypothetical protein QBC38DRAFT_500757 [Podospora fimiseda]